MNQMSPASLVSRRSLEDMTELLEYMVHVAVGHDAKIFLLVAAYCIPAFSLWLQSLARFSFHAASEPCLPPGPATLVDLRVRRCGCAWSPPQ
jgi:hypothetical protein